MYNSQEQKNYLRNNPQLKAPNVKEYVSPELFQERMQEFKKISEDIVYFAEKYFYIISLDKRKINY